MAKKTKTKESSIFKQFESLSPDEIKVLYDCADLIHRTSKETIERLISYIEQADKFINSPYYPEDFKKVMEGNKQLYVSDLQKLRVNMKVLETGLPKFKELRDLVATGEKNSFEV